MIDSLLKKECDLEYFHNNGYVRKKCTACGSFFWTLNPENELCSDQPCVDFGFINNPISKKPCSISKVRQKFITYFENNNHSRVYYPETGNRCPVIARWRSDIYLTIASIADFQPHVTSGDVPPPSNPLVISQPCIRLNDLEEVGHSGRHLTMFEMMGHHAFNKNIDEIYWKEKTVEYCDDFFCNYIGIPRELINYKEQMWIGGGNAGPCIEVISKGLEIATLVFMNMKEQTNGNIKLDGKNYTQNPLNIVDTGYGLERIAWFTQGTRTVYESVFPEVIKFILDDINNDYDLADIYSLADHSKCLAFMLGDGIVPSNVKAGYLARLIIRRSLRFLDKLKINILLNEIVGMHLNLLKKEFPSLIQEKDNIFEILEIETKKFDDTLSKGEGLIKRIIKEKEIIDQSQLITLYDTYGMPPDIVKNVADGEGINVTIPENFDSMIAELHSHDKSEENEEEKLNDLPETKSLYNQNHYLKEFEGKVLWRSQSEDGTRVILDMTAFYPDGGGQPGDRGYLSTDRKNVFVKQVEKEGNSIIHTIDGELNVGDTVTGKIDWNHRYTLMKHHTGTHLVNGALRKIFGEHIWQSGSQLGESEARFDFSHYKSISDEEIKKIEELANEFIKKEVSVEKKVLTRNEAEREYGFRLYQGGVPPGNKIRVLNIPDVDVEACGGTHLNNTKEVGKIRILKTERIQDGVNRVIFAAGEKVDAHQKEENDYFNNIIEIVKDKYFIEEKNNISDQLKKSSKILSVPVSQIDKTIKRFLNEVELNQKTTVNNLSELCGHLFRKWKKSIKTKKIISPDEIEKLKESAEEIQGTKIKLVIGKSKTESTVIVGEIIKEDNYIVHIYDGNKLTSAASKNVKIDLRKIAPEIGKILGGSGGGKPDLTQSGGPNKNNINEALETAKILTIKLINN
jgi:alanyl-tRNA synthetase